MDVNLMDGSPDVRVRIIAAANELYARSGGGKFPSVAAVRHAAQAEQLLDVELLHFHRQGGELARGFGQFILRLLLDLHHHRVGSPRW